MSLAAKVSILINLLFQLHIFHFFYFLFYFLRLLCAVFKDSLTFKNWRFTLFESAKLPISRVDGKQNVSVQFLTFPPTTLNFQGKRGGKRKSPGAFKAIGVMRRRKRGGRVECCLCAEQDEGCVYVTGGRSENVQVVFQERWKNEMYRNVIK